MVPVTQPVLPLLPAQARSIGASAGLLEGPDGGVVLVFGLATFNYASGDEAGRRLAAVQLVTTKIAFATDVAGAFGVSQATLWRWAGAFAQGGVLALVPERPGPRRPSKLTKDLTARIVALEATGLTLLQIAARTDVSTATVRVALGRVAPRIAAQPVERLTAPRAAVAVDDAEPVIDDDRDDDRDHDGDHDAATVAELVVLTAPVPRTLERAAARTGELVEAPVVITQGAHLPLAGLLLTLPGLEMTGLLPVVAEQVLPPMSKGFYGLRATLLMGVVMALLREPRAEGTTRLRPADLGRLLGLDRGPEVKTLRRKLAGPPGRGRISLPRRPRPGLLRHPVSAPQDPHRPDADRWPRALEQRAAGRLDKPGQLLARNLDLPVEPVELGDEFRGQLAAGLAHHVTRTHGCEERLGLRRGQERLRPTRDQLDQQPVQPVHRQRPRGAELVTPVGQQPQRHGGVIHHHLAQARGAQRHHRDRVRVGGVGLAALPGGEHPGSRGQLGRYVHHRLTVGDQALRQMTAHARTSLDRPQTLRPPPSRVPPRRTAAGGHPRRLAARPARPVVAAPDRHSPRARCPRCWVPVVAGVDRHDHLRRPADLPRLRGTG